MNGFDPDSFEGQVIDSLATIKEKIACLPQHAERINKLESYVDMGKGLWLLLAFLITTVGGFLVKHLYAASK